MIDRALVHGDNFAIHRCSDGMRVDRIHLRITQDDVVLRAIGHAGYAVDEAHQRHGYATRAVRLIQQLAREHSLSPLWILIAPDNVTSRRTGCRYRWDGDQTSASRHARLQAAHSERT